ncbi:MAG: hypothetical protein ABWX62_05290 [Microterricola sp.]
MNTNVSAFAGEALNMCRMPRANRALFAGRFVHHRGTQRSAE